MKEYVLSYYPKFSCIANKCKHTCCAGWEINIDKQSLLRYKERASNFSHALKKGINFKKSKFKTDKFKRCAFLNEEGLCDLIINEGKGSLCQVCRDHPRFRSFFDDRTETGLGFCCEEAARIILSTKEKIVPLLVRDDREKEELDFNQKNVLDFRKVILSVVQDRSLGIKDRIESVLRTCDVDFSKLELKKILKVFLSFERIDKGWTKRLKSVDKTSWQRLEEDMSHYCEQFLVNSIYRHLSDAEDTMWVRARMLACVISWLIILAIINSERKDKQILLELVVDVVRAYSEEVEYSQKNLNKLFDFCYRYI